MIDTVFILFSHFHKFCLTITCFNDCKFPIRKVYISNFRKIHRKTPTIESFFSKIASGPASLLKNDYCMRFLTNFLICVRTSILENGCFVNLQLNQAHQGSCKNFHSRHLKITFELPYQTILPMNFQNKLIQYLCLCLFEYVF